MNNFINNIMNLRDQGILKFVNGILVISIFSILFLSSYAHAGADWQVEIIVETGNIHNRLVIGADDTATNGYDCTWDSYALLSGQLQAFIPHPEWGLIHSEFHRDIRAHAPEITIEWLLIVDNPDTSLIGSSITIRWSFLNVPSDYQMVLINDANNDQTDMQLNSSYQFTYSGYNPFRINIIESTSCLNLPVRILETSQYYPSLQEAYTAVQPGQTIQTRAVVLVQDMTTNQNKAITIKGGYDCNYENIIGQTTMKGLFTIDSGSVDIENVIVEE